MSSLITRFLTVLVFLLAALTCVLFALHVSSFPSLPERSVSEWRKDTDFPRRSDAGLLSRFPLVPFFRSTTSVVGVMIENHRSARPHHRGLEHALMVQEFFVEGMISRFLVLFDTEDLPDTVGPIRSLRPYFVDAGLPLAQMIIHAGGSPEAFERARQEGDLVTVNALADSTHFYREPEIPAPHDLFADQDGLQALLPVEDPLTGVPWPPYRVGTPSSGSGAETISIDFHHPDHNVQYVYEYSGGTYERINGNVISSLHPRNVLILAMPITGVGEQGRLTIPVTGKGDLLLFRSGTVARGTWSKAGHHEPFIFSDEDGDEIRFAQGSTWMTVVEDLYRVEWE